MKVYRLVFNANTKQYIFLTTQLKMTVHEHESNLNLALQRNENLKKAAAARLAANREWNQKNRPKKKK